MAAEINTLSVNGRLVSWSAVRLTFDGDLFTGFTSITFDHALETVFGYAATQSHAPIGESDGKYVPGEIKLKGHTHAISEFRDWVAAKAPDGISYGVPRFPGQLQFDMGDGGPEIRVEFLNVGIRGEGGGAEESADPNQEEITLKCTGIKRNGKTLWNSAGQV
jgi:hypothetical protein